MKRLSITKTVGLSLLALGLASLTAPIPATAQGDASLNRDTGARATQDDRNDRGKDWGWLGLLGLTGLAGLRRRQEHHEPARQRAANH
jgi:MYXO-CTERM domain-containing protein